MQIIDNIMKKVVCICIPLGIALIITGCMCDGENCCLKDGKIYTDFSEAYSFKNMDMEEFDEIKVDVGTVDLEIQTTEKETYAVAANVCYETKEEPVIEVVDDKLNIYFEDKSLYNVTMGFSGMGAKENKITIYVPEKELENVDIDIDEGEILINDISSKKVDIDTSDGEMVFKNMCADSLSAHTDNGDIAATSNFIGKTNLSTCSGNVKINIDQFDKLYNIITKASAGDVYIDKDCEKICDKSSDNIIELESDCGDINASFTND